VGDALLEIRDNHLYPDLYATFEEYQQKRWGMGTSAQSRPSPMNEESTAYHEAGHVVVKSCLGLGYSGISIIPDNDSWGRVESSKPEKPSTYAAIERGDRWHHSRFRAEKWVMVLQAGDVARRQHDFPSVGPYYSQSDLEKCNALLRNYHPDKENPDPDLHYDLLHEWTVSLIEQNWHSVEAVAKSLLEHRELSGTEVRAVIDTANQEQSRMNVQPLLDLVQAAKEMQRSKESHT
jgi:hypothetical protein